MHPYVPLCCGIIYSFAEQRIAMRLGIYPFSGVFSCANHSIICLRCNITLYSKSRTIATQSFRNPHSTKKPLPESRARDKGFHGFTYRFCTCWTLQPLDFTAAGFCNRRALQPLSRKRLFPLAVRSHDLASFVYKPFN